MFPVRTIGWSWRATRRVLDASIERVRCVYHVIIHARGLKIRTTFSPRGVPHHDKGTPPFIPLLYSPNTFLCSEYISYTVCAFSRINFGTYYATIMNAAIAVCYGKHSSINAQMDVSVRAIRKPVSSRPSWFYVIFWTWWVSHNPFSWDELSSLAYGAAYMADILRLCLKERAPALFFCRWTSTPGYIGAKARLLLVSVWMSHWISAAW